MREGDLIVGRFRLDAPAGAGAMGQVFRARDCEHSDRVVAIKTWLSDGSSPGRFLREAAALAELAEPAVVSHILHGVTEQGEPFLAMEWIDGPTLAQQLAGPGLCPIETLQLGQRLLHGLAALHARGIVHRDIKPSNIMLPHAQVAAAQILDLGVARFAQASTVLTAQGSHVGTPRYMAPEQIRDPRTVDGRADVFALGCVLFECLTGQPAFPGDDPLAVLAQILFARPMDPSELRSELPEELDQLLAGLLARRPELRSQVTPELFDAFARLLAPPYYQQLLPLPPAPQLRAADTVAPLLGETQVDASCERPSSPRLLDRASQPVHSIFVRAPRQALVGRERDLAELVAWLDTTDPITLWGGAGVGKTRLAYELAREAVRRQIVAPHAVVLCDLSEARDSADIVRIIASEVGISISAQESVEDFLGRTLRKLGPLLLIVERGEHLVRELEPLIQLWIRQAPALRLLLTSRVLLRSTRAYELGPLASRAMHPGAAAAPVVRQPSAAAELVLALARASAPPASQVQFDSQTVEQAEQIAAALEGNPLAIELALARLPLLGFAGIVARLPAPLGAPDARHEPAQFAGMRAAIEWSWNLLHEPERWAFMQCSVFRGSFTLTAAERVVVSPDAASSVLEIVQSLHEQSLLVSRSGAASSGDGRLAMPAVLREFAREQYALVSQPGGKLAGVRARHAAYCVELAELRDPSDSALPELELDDWIFATDYLGSPDGFDVSGSLSLLLALEPVLLSAGLSGRLVSALDRALAALPALAPSDPALARRAVRARQLKARLLAPAGQRDRAEAELERALGEARLLQDPQLLGTTLLDLGVVQHFGRNLASARDYYEAALAALADADDPVAEARCHGNLGAVFHDQAQLVEAAAGYRQAIALLPEHGQQRLLANFQGNLALLEHERGRGDEARALYEQASQLLEALLDARLLGIVLGNFATLELAQGQTDRALARLERAQALLERSGDRRSEALSLGRLGVALALVGSHAEAARRLAQAQRLLRKDELGRAVVSLLGAFVALLAAETASPAAAAVTLSSVAESCQRARTDLLAGRPLYDQSDDLRLYLAILEPRLASAQAKLNPTASSA